MSRGGLAQDGSASIIAAYVGLISDSENSAVCLDFDPRGLLGNLVGSRALVVKEILGRFPSRSGILFRTASADPVQIFAEPHRISSKDLPYLEISGHVMICPFHVNPKDWTLARSFGSTRSPIERIRSMRQVRYARPLGPGNIYA